MMKIIILIIFTLTSFDLLATCAGSQQTFKKNENLEVETILFQPKKDTDRLVLILPPTGGVNFIDRSYAKYFCKKGIAALIVGEWSENYEVTYELSVHDDYYRNAQEAIDYIIESFSQYRIGILGTSLGALHSSISFATNEKIDSAFLIVGGGNFAGIIAYTDQEATLAIKKARFESMGFQSDLEYEMALKEQISYEPTRIPFNRKGRKIGMSISHHDSTVPTEYQLELRDSWQPDLILNSNWGHENTVIKTWLLHKRKILEFFQS